MSNESQRTEQQGDAGMGTSHENNVSRSNPTSSYAHVATKDMNSDFSKAILISESVLSNTSSEDLTLSPLAYKLQRVEEAKERSYWEKSKVKQLSDQKTLQSGRLHAEEHAQRKAEPSETYPQNMETLLQPSIRLKSPDTEERDAFEDSTGNGNIGFQDIAGALIKDSLELVSPEPDSESTRPFHMGSSTQSRVAKVDTGDDNASLSPISHSGFLPNASSRRTSSLASGDDEPPLGMRRVEYAMRKLGRHPLRQSQTTEPKRYPSYTTITTKPISSPSSNAAGYESETDSADTRRSARGSPQHGMRYHRFDASRRSFEIDDLVPSMILKATLTRCSVLSLTATETSLHSSESDQASQEGDEHPTDDKDVDSTVTKIMDIVKNVCIPAAEKINSDGFLARSLYWQGRAEQRQDKWNDAVESYERALMLGIEWFHEPPVKQGKDAATRLQEVKMQIRRKENNEITFPANANHLETNAYATEQLHDQLGPVHLSTRLQFQRVSAPMPFSPKEKDYIKQGDRKKRHHRGISMESVAEIIAKEYEDDGYEREQEDGGDCESEGTHENLASILAAQQDGYDSEEIESE